MRPALAALLLAIGAAAAAQTAPSTPTTPVVSPISYPSVAEALRALQARDGDGTVVTHQEGWVVINEPQASAQWSFVPQGHAAWPAVVRRTIVRQPDGRAAVVTQRLCEAPAAACDALVAEFAKMDDRIVQAVGARNRPRPPQPQPAQ